MASLPRIPPDMPQRKIFDPERARVFNALPVDARRFYTSIEAGPGDTVVVTFSRMLELVFSGPDPKWWIDPRYQIVASDMTSITVRKV